MSEFLELIDDTNCGFNPIPKIYYDYAPTLRAGRFGLKKKGGGRFGKYTY